MRIFSKIKGIKGFVSVYNRVLRFRYMIKQEAQRRARILTFWQNYGLEATMEAFNIKERTLYYWKASLKAGKGKLESLNPKSKSPINKRKRIIPETIKEYIINQRNEHYRLGKEKLATLLEEDKQVYYSFSKVGRILNDLKKEGLLRKPTKLSFYGKTGRLIKRNIKKRKKLRIKDYKPQRQGDLLQLDTVVYFLNGIRRYIVTAIDLKSDFSFAFGYNTPSSLNTKDFFQKLQSVCPFKIRRIQTDNGSEFEKYFREYITNQNIVHFHNYPKCPKMNAYIERFNRTIQEEFANWQTHLLLEDLNQFNRKLMDYLIWYNTKRPHHSLGLISPMKYIMINSNLTALDCNMWWTNTFLLQKNTTLL